MASESISSDVKTAKEITESENLSPHDQPIPPLYQRMSAGANGMRKAATRAMKKLANRFGMLSLMIKGFNTKNEPNAEDDNAGCDTVFE
jgi:hypothetical protein